MGMGMGMGKTEIVDGTSDQWAVAQLRTSLRILNNALAVGGKIVLAGMGKSHKIAAKSVATLNSLRVHAALLHAGEALHGDLGIIREDHGDALVVVSASGNSPEIDQLLNHVPTNVPVILVTCTRHSPLESEGRVVSIILAECSNSDNDPLFGHFDAVAIALAELHISDYQVRKELFAINHPGGAIGINHQREKLGSFNNTNNTSLLSVNTVATSMTSLYSNGSIAKTQTITLEKLPDLELDILRLLTLNDYIVLSENCHIIDCRKARSLYRDCTINDYPWPKTRNTILESALPHTSP
ncbi:hypothetical protein JL09_g4146 [Pichia kudriavzevii]|uniref:SIS domain-containing protein n=1 Tax=Pichia kudriavzevii TaxID=4909 RepID=A0A099NV34_PICKU|nr:hypothetical protein JL09_g4146 [Pichia kudriavzevii]